jgi:aspartate dehydrogenase
MKHVGIIGYGRIGAYLHKKIEQTQGLNVSFIYEIAEEKTRGLDNSILAKDPESLEKRRADLVIEAADFRAVGALAPQIVKRTDMLILSASALADENLATKLQSICEETGHRFYIPHGALLGMDGFQDARNTFDEISITTVKPPKNLDFTFQERWKLEEIKARAVLHDGSTREVCRLFPRNVNSHAVLAISGLGFDKTRSVLIADPDAITATHHIVAKGGGTTTEIIQSSPIKGVTGDFTLASVYGTIKRILIQSHGLNIV